jgi:hypothetical protein
MVALANEMLSAYFPDTPLLPFTGKASPFMVRFSHRMIRSPRELTADFYSRIVGSVRFALVSFPGVGYKARTLRDYLFVTEFFGKNRLADSVPICYLYGPARLAVKRWSEGAMERESEGATESRRC